MGLGRRVQEGEAGMKHKDTIRGKFGYDGFAFQFEPFPFIITVVLIAPKKSSDFHSELARFHRRSKRFRQDVPNRVFAKVNPMTGCNACIHYFRDDTLGMLVIDYTRADYFSIMHECDHLMTYMAEDGFMDKKNVFNLEFWAYTATHLAKRIIKRAMDSDIGISIKPLS